MVGIASLREVNVADVARPNFRDSKHYRRHHQSSREQAERIAQQFLKGIKRGGDFGEKRNVSFKKIYLISS